MNKDWIREREMETIRGNLGLWGKAVPELFTFDARDGRGAEGHV